MYDVIVKRSRSLSHLLMSSCYNVTVPAIQQSILIHTPSVGKNSRQNYDNIFKTKTFVENTTRERDKPQSGHSVAVEIWQIVFADEMSTKHRVLIHSYTSDRHISASSENASTHQYVFYDRKTINCRVCNKQHRSPLPLTDPRDAVLHAHRVVRK